MKERIIYQENKRFFLSSDSEAMKITSCGDHPIEGYLLDGGIVERENGQKLDFFVLKFYFEQIGD